MSLVHAITKLIAVTERVSPKARKSKLWRRQAEEALRAAMRAEYDGTAREGPLEEEECETGASLAGFTALKGTLDGILPKPRTSTSKGTPGRTVVELPTRSKR
jgi:hypothetical protein